MSEQEQRKAQQRGRQSRKGKTNNMIVIPDDPNMKIYYKDIEDTRTNLRGGGICKKGMNKKARGANS